MQQPRSDDPAVYADDLRIGDTFQLGSYLVTREDLLGFAHQWDPQIFHLDEDVATEGHFGGLIASGLHTLSIYQRLAVLAVFQNWQVIAGRSFREAKFLRPVRAEDTLTGTVRVEGVVPDARERALVTTSAELTNGAGRPVLTLLVDAYVMTRSGRA
ncbi:MaoC/PaaZ C-terminal domain-containing protein [Leekyejoonella antrihumi]|uniref:Dehydratase n=1 Tax=Leekyejoonella antrihumi TaxID=1660198 RepID=A0A563E4S0_9MICO|nr:MaoC/PaaZ C-terminal domain-containing protein [Leekyejoonella antrihumi]TWP37232.1 dehydratase [Leekyejoonella antrihumi]